MTTDTLSRTQQAAEKILRAFQNPSTLPAALAPMFVRQHDHTPCRSWSWMNQVLVALQGHTDARGFRQWQQVGRHVCTGERAMYILCPIIRQVAGESTDERIAVVSGFRAAPVFGYEQTEGEPLPTEPADVAWLEELPLRAVADRWGIAVDLRDGATGVLGSFRPGQISLGVRNLSTWCHELVHAADHRRGGLTELGQHWRSETVAELGGAVLLELLGFHEQADLGGCWEYIGTYAERAGIPPLTACHHLLQRTCDAVALVLAEAKPSL